MSLTVKHKAFRIRRGIHNKLDVIKQFTLFIQPAYKTVSFKVDVNSHLHPILNGLEVKNKTEMFLSISK